MRTLSLRELNRATLARQLLLRRQRLPVTRAIERIAGLQAQENPAPYVGLWSRLSDFDPRVLDRALARGRVVKATLMRATLHLVTRDDFEHFVAALDSGGLARIGAQTSALVEPVLQPLRAFAVEPRSRRELADLVEQQHGLDMRIGVGAGYVWEALRIRGRIVHTADSARWAAPSRMRWIALDAVDAIDVADARRHLVRRYLGAFGPATRADISQWSGIRVRDLEPALVALEPLRRFADERGRELLDLPRAPLPPPDEPAPARLLPRFDNLVLSHDDRRRVLPEEYRAPVIQGGDVAASFLVDGLVAGTWSLEKGRVRLRPFAPLPRGSRRELEEEAAMLEAFVRTAEQA